MDIVQLENPPKNKNSKVKMMRNSKGIGRSKSKLSNHDMNEINELKEFYYSQ